MATCRPPVAARPAFRSRHAQRGARLRGEDQLEFSRRHRSPKNSRCHLRSLSRLRPFRNGVTLAFRGLAAPAVGDEDVAVLRPSARPCLRGALRSVTGAGDGLTDPAEGRCTS